MDWDEEKVIIRDYICAILKGKDKLSKIPSRFGIGYEKLLEDAAEAEKKWKKLVKILDAYSKILKELGCAPVKIDCSKKYPAVSTETQENTRALLGHCMYLIKESKKTKRIEIAISNILFIQGILVALGICTLDEVGMSEI